MPNSLLRAAFKTVLDARKSVSCLRCASLGKAPAPLCSDGVLRGDEKLSSVSRHPEMSPWCERLPQPQGAPSLFGQSMEDVVTPTSPGFCMPSQTGFVGAYSDSPADEVVREEPPR